MSLGSLAAYPWSVVALVFPGAGAGMDGAMATGSTAGAAVDGHVTADGGASGPGAHVRFVVTNSLRLRRFRSSRERR